MKIKNWFWGALFICAAGLVIADQMGYLFGMGVPFIILLIILIPVIVEGVKHLNFFGIILPIAALLIVCDRKVDITKLSNWSIVIAAVFLSIGLSLIFKRNPVFGTHKTYHHVSETSENVDDSIVSFHETFGASTKYLKSTNLKKAAIHCSFGAIKVYFNDANLDQSGAELHLDCSFAGIELYIPRTWNVRVNANVTLGGIDEKNKGYETDGSVLLVTGSVTFSGVDIYYI